MYKLYMVRTQIVKMFTIGTFESQTNVFRFTEVGLAIY